MSKLIDLIGRLGQQSAQPLGFGALTGKVETSPALALIGSATLSTFAADLNAVGRDLVDAVVFDSDEVLASAGSVELSELIWGVTCRYMESETLESLISAGCDFVIIDPEDAPAAIVSHPDLAVFLALESPVGRTTSAALRSLGVAGSLNTSGVGAGAVRFHDLVSVCKVAASIGGVMLLEANGDISVDDLTALRDAGMDGLVVSLSEPERTGQLAQSIRDLPARKRSETRGLQVAAPRDGD